MCGLFQTLTVIQFTSLRIGISLFTLASQKLLPAAICRQLRHWNTQFWQSPTRPWFLFVPAQGKPIAVIPEIGASLMQQGWVDDVRTWSAPSPDDDGMSLLTELLAPLSASRARLGVMKGHETMLRMPLSDWERLLTALPGLNIIDATK